MTVIKEHKMNGGTRVVHKFPNGYGASVIRGPYSYGGDQGLYEIGILIWFGEDINDCKLDYSTPITNDVLGYLTPDEVEETLNKIEALPNAN